MLGWLMFAIVDFGARRGLAESAGGDSAEDSAKQRARGTGVRGETYAYWYLRRQGYTVVARNYTVPGIKGEIDMAGYDGSVLAFVEVKTRSASLPEAPGPEEAVNREKQRNVARVARQFMRMRRIEGAACRFDILAIETKAGARPMVRLHKGAFSAEL